jgi:hypothetical protein
MTEQKFKTEMRRAQQMQRSDDVDPMRAEYWSSYQRGLRRAYHGERFGTPEEHALWMSLINRRDERSRQRGRGYRDGFAYDEAAARPGRPSVGTETLPSITVPRDLRAALEARAEALGLPVPDARREAYRLFAGGVDAAIDDDLARRTGRTVE